MLYKYYGYADLVLYNIYPRADLLVFVRDHQHFDLGGFIKVQVKNRPSFNEEPLDR